MRALATIAMSFSAAVFAAVLLPWEGWIGPAAGGLALLGAVGLLAKGVLRRHRRAWLRWVLISLSAAAALVWFGFHQTYIVEPVRDKCGAEHHFSALVVEFPEKTGFGAKVTASLGHRARAIYYGDERVMELCPGQRVRGMAQWQDASEVRGEKLAAFTARGVYRARVPVADIGTQPQGVLPAGVELFQRQLGRDTGGAGVYHAADGLLL